jgi:ABC-type phosphate transport system permease subunit
MSKRLIGIVLAALGSVVVGLIAAEWFFGLFNKTVPPAVITAFNRGAAHGAFIGYGIGLGVMIFAWTLLALALARFFPGTPKPPSSSR